MINVTENEALEALTSEEEKYPAGIQPLPLPRLPALQHCQTKDPSSKPRSGTHKKHPNAYPLQLGQRHNATPAVVCTKAWNTLTKQ